MAWGNKMILEYLIIKNDIGKSINQILKEQYEFSNRLFSKLIKNKAIFLNGKNIDTRMIINNIGSKITIDLNYEEDNTNIVSKKMNLDIVYEDDGLLIINKPAGIAVHPSLRHYEDSLASGVKYYYEEKGIYKKIRPVNRLDLNTSGLIIFAKNEYIQENLIRQMEKGTFEKEYLVIVEGKLEKDFGTIDAPIARKNESIIERCVSGDGQRAVTEYEVLRKNEKYSLVKCKLHTGRTHQIRVHFSFIGHPLLGDTLYGKPSVLIDRQALHSYRISFIHPIIKEKLEFEYNMPDDMKSIYEINYNLKL